MSLDAALQASSFPELGPGPAGHPHGIVLGRHLLACSRARGKTFLLRCFGERLHGWFGPRFCTTVLAAAVVMVLLTTVA